MAQAGKLLRGALVNLLLVDADEYYARIGLRIGAWLEIAHTGLLIHDDIIDNDSVRRGEISLHHYFTLQRPNTAKFHGIGQALAIGDYLLLSAQADLYQLAINPKLAHAIAARWSQELANTAAGQIRDTNGHRQSHLNVNANDILETYGLKTTCYSFSLPLYISAQLAGYHPKTAYQLDALGSYLGICFQIKDDQAGLMSTADRIGKPIGSDIRDNTMTLWRYYLQPHLSKKERKITADIFGSPDLTEEDICYIRWLYHKYHVDEKVTIQCHQLSTRAHCLIKKMSLPHYIKHYLYELTEMTLIKSG